MRLHQNLYKRFIEKNLSLGDQLAAVRSILANERTFLAYQRTSIALAVSGVSLIHFFDTAWIIITGWCLLPTSIISVIIGIYRYIKMRDLILSLEIEKSHRSM